jgi:hypothetical protein
MFLLVFTLACALVGGRVEAVDADLIRHPARVETRER